MGLRRVIMSMSIRLSRSRMEVARQESRAERGMDMPKTLEELRSALGFDKPSARVRSAKISHRRPHDDRDQQQPSELTAAARRAREALLSPPASPSVNGTKR